MEYNVWEEITNPFPQFNGEWVLGLDKIFYPHTLLGMWLLIHAGICKVLDCIGQNGNELKLAQKHTVANSEVVYI